MPNRLLPRRRLVDRRQRQRHLNQFRPHPTPTHNPHRTPIPHPAQLHLLLVARTATQGNPSDAAY